jgi:WD40 repeat protein
MTITLLAAVLAVTIATPAKITTIDSGKGREPTQLAWSSDGSQLFLQTSERDAQGMAVKHRYFTVSVAEPALKSADAPPAWATEYWAWKSGQHAPGSKAFGIDVKQGQQKLSATATPMGGDLARGGADPGGTGGTAAGDVASARAQTQTQNMVSLTVKGENVGEFVGQQFLPGYTFGWSPQSIGMIVYANQSGHLAVMDQDGHKQQIESTKDVILPAWSSDGSKIAFLQKAGKNKYDLFIAGVTQ